MEDNIILKTIKIKQLLRGFPVRVGSLEDLFGDSLVANLEAKGMICRHKIDQKDHWILLE